MILLYSVDVSRELLGQTNIFKIFGDWGDEDLDGDDGLNRV